MRQGVNNSLLNAGTRNEVVFTESGLTIERRKTYLIIRMVDESGVRQMIVHWNDRRGLQKKMRLRACSVSCWRNEPADVWCFIYRRRRNLDAHSDHEQVCEHHDIWVPRFGAARTEKRIKHVRHRWLRNLLALTGVGGVLLLPLFL